MKKPKAPRPPLTIQMVAPDQIRPNAYNPNREDEATFTMLKKSMAENGFTQPILINATTREIVDGEHRWRAAQELGYKLVPVVEADFTPEQMRVATLRHNRTRGAEDVDLTGAIFSELERMGGIDYAKSGLGLDNTDVERMLARSDFAAPDLFGVGEFSASWDHRDDVNAGLELEGEHPGGDGNTVATEAARASDDKPWRLVLIFTVEESKVVKQVLGREAAATVLSLCRERYVPETEPTEAPPKRRKRARDAG